MTENTERIEAALSGIREKLETAEVQGGKLTTIILQLQSLGSAPTVTKLWQFFYLLRQLFDMEDNQP